MCRPNFSLVFVIGQIWSGSSFRLPIVTAKSFWTMNYFLLPPSFASSRNPAMLGGAPTAVHASPLPPHVPAVDPPPSRRSAGPADSRRTERGTNTRPRLCPAPKKHPAPPQDGSPPSSSSASRFSTCSISSPYCNMLSTTLSSTSMLSSLEISSGTYDTMV